jgi:glutamyl-tRNA(Gln) amidotransferase subunit E
MDYKKLGLKAGLEIHQQLDTKYKLFCKSSAAMKDKEVIGQVKRKQHPVAGELGVVDIAMLHEMLRDRTFHYQLFPHETCLVEIDEEPPHEMNLEALEVALKIALMLNCTIPDELQVMRKSISDGSNTSAFQRTIVVGLDGFLKYKGKKVEITFINLEEDAAPTVTEENGNVTFRLSRLGVPLIEIGTGLLEGFTPDEIQDIAFNIGMLLRSTGKVKRGIGTIRQDVNVSVKAGERTELKGMQDLWTMSKAIQNEITRQLTMSEIRSEIRRRGVKKVGESFVDVNSLISNTKSKILRQMLDTGATVFAMKLPKFAGMLKKEIYPGKTFGKDLAEYVAAFGVKGILHSDEDLAKYAAVEDFRGVREYLKAGEKDAIILIGEHNDKGKVAKLLLQRINLFLEKPEKETRAVGDDGHIRFNRPLPGAQRLYPETDVLPFSVSREWLKKLKRELPESWMKKLEKFKKMKLSDDLAKQILRSEYLELFEKLAKKGDPILMANVFTNILKDLQRQNVNVSNLSEKHFEEIFQSVRSKKIMKESLPDILKYLAENSSQSVSSAVAKLNLKALSKAELLKIVKEVVSQPNIQFDKAVGLVMSQVRGRADPQEVIKLVKKFK